MQIESKTRKLGNIATSIPLQILQKKDYETYINTLKEIVDKNRRR